MKKPSFLLIFLLSSITALAQSVKYETFIYSSDDLADEIQSLCEERNSTAVMWEIYSMPAKNRLKVLHLVT